MMVVMMMMILLIFTYIKKSSYPYQEFVPVFLEGLSDDELKKEAKNEAKNDALSSIIKVSIVKIFSRSRISTTMLPMLEHVFSFLGS